MLGYTLLFAGIIVGVLGGGFGTLVWLYRSFHAGMFSGDVYRRLVAIVITVVFLAIVGAIAFLFGAFSKEETMEVIQDKDKTPVEKEKTSTVAAKTEEKAPKN